MHYGWSYLQYVTSASINVHPESEIRPKFRIIGDDVDLYNPLDGELARADVGRIDANQCTQEDSTLFWRNSSVQSLKMALIRWNTSVNFQIETSLYVK